MYILWCISTYLCIEIWISWCCSLCRSFLPFHAQWNHSKLHFNVRIKYKKKKKQIIIINWFIHFRYPTLSLAKSPMWLLARRCYDGHEDQLHVILVYVYRILLDHGEMVWHSVHFFIAIVLTLSTGEMHEVAKRAKGSIKYFTSPSASTALPGFSIPKVNYTNIINFYSN